MKIKRRYRPIPSVGCYVPGGEASYPSTLVMTVIPAKVADVPRIAVCSPPGKNGEINPLTLVAADICGVNEAYRVGGAQAIAALAYGTETIAPVDKIVGPGNKYVLAAKIAVSQHAPIDLPAGPSEVVVLADESAKPKTIALDLISQAEHGTDGISILVTSSAELANKVAEETSKQLESLPNRDVVLKSLAKNGTILLCGKVDEAIAFINDFAPEHLEIRTQKAHEIAEKISSAGLILVGEYTPVSASDYCLGTNHVLPTGGRGRVFSGLSVLDYIKTISIVECSESYLADMRRPVNILAESEGLLNHAQAVEGRFRN